MKESYQCLELKVFKYNLELTLFKYSNKYLNTLKAYS